MSKNLDEKDGKLFCQDCGNETDEYGDTKSTASGCSYCPVECQECGYGTCDNSC